MLNKWFAKIQVDHYNTGLHFIDGITKEGDCPVFLDVQFNPNSVT